MAVFGKSYSASETLDSFTGVNNIPLALEANKAYKKSLIRFNATVNVTTAGASVVFNDYGFYSLLKTIKLLLSGHNAFDWTPYIFKYVDAFLTPNQSYYGDTLPSATDMQTVGSYPIELNIPIHYNQPEVLQSLATMLLTSDTYVKKPVLEVSPDTLNAPFAAATGTLPTYNLSDISLYLVNDEIIDGVSGKVGFSKFSVKSKVFSSSGPNQEIAIPANEIYRGMVFEVLATGTLIGNPSAISFISVYNGNNEIIKDATFEDFQAFYMENYPSDRSTYVSTNGRVMMDFCYKERTLENAIHTLNNYNVYFKLNLASACRVNLYTWSFS